ncbi:GNAT family N-acetyltransferase [Kribbella sp. NPDC004536]|uniref:GNAT family N-acetyltransferase n=1 Tax=Kribbella sp. NPDC004536 TaxID=3364106 RepID=UPI0036B72446
MEIAPATRDDVERMIAELDGYPAAQYHVRDRWDVQQRDEGVQLVAVEGAEIVGRTMVLRRSKYDEVRADADPVEINALHAFVRGKGVGTALIRAAEAVAVEWERTAIGMGVEPDNSRARGLYERLGYVLWSGPRVVDRWTEQAADGTVVRRHADECDYLLKRL